MLTSEPVFAAYALTEPAAGSDAAGIQTRCRKDGNDWIVQRLEVLHHECHVGQLVHRFRDRRPFASPWRDHGVRDRSRCAGRERRQDGKTSSASGPATRLW